LSVVCASLFFFFFLIVFFSSFFLYLCVFVSFLLPQSRSFLSNKYNITCL
jgi:hypothetical protein